MNRLKKNKIKILIYIMATSLFIISILSYIKSYSLFESNIKYIANMDIAKWEILVNNEDIMKSKNKEFNIDKLNMPPSERTLKGKIAPGSKGFADIQIKPKNIDVSFKYEIYLDLNSVDNRNIIIKIDEENSTSKLTKNKFGRYERIITLDEMKENPNLLDNIRISVEWKNREANNKKDTEIGLNALDKYKIPVDIKFTQVIE